MNPRTQTRQALAVLGACFAPAPPGEPGEAVRRLQPQLRAESSDAFRATWRTTRRTEHVNAATWGDQSDAFMRYLANSAPRSRPITRRTPAFRTA